MIAKPFVTLRRALRRGADQSAFALPTVLLLTVAAFGIGTVAVTSTVNSTRATTRDDSSQTALAIAEAGANQAVLRYNKIPTTASLPCLIEGNGDSILASSTGSAPAGWCAAVTESNYNGGGYSYRVKPATAAGAAMVVVSTGTYNGVSRRVALGAELQTSSTSSGATPFASASVVSKNYIFLDADAGIHANVAAGGTAGSPQSGKPIVLYDRARLCGNAQIPPGTTFYRGNINNGQYNNYFGGSNCASAGGATSYGSVSLPDVTMPTATDNAARFFTTNQNDASKDHYNGQAPSWNAGSRTLLLNSGTHLELKGSVYGFCSITLNSGADITVAQNAKLYFDSPENCNGNTNPLVINAGSHIMGTANPVNFALLFVGSPTVEQQITVTGNTQLPKTNFQQCSEVWGNNGFVLYAPWAKVYLNSDAKICGNVAAKAIWLQSRSYIYSSAGNAAWSIDGGGSTTTSHYTVNSFVECSATTGSQPDSNC